MDDFKLEHAPNFRGKRVTIMGLGQFGAGIGAARFFSEHDAQVTVTDILPAGELLDSITQLGDCCIDLWKLGQHDAEDFENADLVVASPAIPRNHPLLCLARKKGVLVSSEMNLFWQWNRGRILGVTGSNGKSTTAALVHAMLSAGDFRCHLGGNIGKSLLPRVHEIAAGDWVVLELSSFQLESLDEIHASPEIAVVTNFAPNHLDRHGCLDNYRKAKQTILRWQSPDNVAVMNGRDRDLKHWPMFAGCLHFGDGKKSDLGVFPNGEQFVWRDDVEKRVLDLRSWLPLRGEHNLENAMAATCAAMCAGATVENVREGLENFTPLPHRMEPVGEFHGRRFFNDSLATTPESAMKAIESFEESVILIAGGYDKQIDLRFFAKSIAEKVKAVSLIGETADQLSVFIDEFRTENGLAERICESLPEAVKWAIEQSEEGDAILLSPGCASYDMFRNFAERGDCFRRLVERMKEDSKAISREHLP